MGMTRETFESADMPVKLNMLYDETQSIRALIEELRRDLKEKNRYYKVVAFFGGVVGGILATFGKWLVK